jgi:chromosomal replication initiation ATPase DnaA
MRDQTKTIAHRSLLLRGSVAENNLPPTNHASHSTVLISSVVSLVFSINEQQLFHTNRGKADIAFARQVAMYLAHIVCGFSLTEVGKHFGRDRTTVSYACSLIEDNRENPELDFLLDLMEQTIRKVWSLNDFSFVPRTEEGGINGQNFA